MTRSDERLGLLLIASFVSTVLLSFSTRAWAIGDWVPDGQPVCLATGNQTSPAVAADGSGGVFLAWEDLRGADFDIYIQHLSESGVALWSANGMPVCTAIKDQRLPSISADGAGGVWVVWGDSRGTASAVYVQHIDATGNPTTGWPVNGKQLFTGVTLALMNPKVVANNTGGAYVVGDEYANVLTSSIVSGITIQAIDGTGAVLPGWTNSGVFAKSGGCDATFCQIYDTSRLIPDGTGGAYLSFNFFFSRLEAPTGRSSELWHIRPGGNCTPISSGLGGVTGPPLMSADAAGNLFPLTDDGTNLNVLRFLSNHSLSWSVRTAGGNLRNRAAVAADGLGGTYTAWGTTANLRASHWSPTGTLATGWAIGGDQFVGSAVSRSEPVMSGDGLGQAVAFWTDNRLGNLDLYAQLLGASGVSNAFGVGGGLVCGAAGNLQVPVAISSGPGAVVVAWADERSPSTGTGVDIYAQKLTTSGPTPVLVSAFEAMMRGSSVLLRWHVVAEMTPTLSVYRLAGDDRAWERIGVPQTRGDDQEFVDDAVEPGRAYAYRVVAADGSILGETRITVPESPRLALRVIGRNPADNEIRFATQFVPGHSGQAECVDIKGRILWASSIERPNGAERSYALSTKSWASGVYWLRVMQDGDRKIARVVVFH